MNGEIRDALTFHCECSSEHVTLPAWFLGTSTHPKDHRTFPGTLSYFIQSIHQESRRPRACPQSSWSICRRARPGLVFRLVRQKVGCTFKGPISPSGVSGSWQAEETWKDLVWSMADQVIHPILWYLKSTAIFIPTSGSFHFQETSPKESEATSKHFRGYVFTGSIFSLWKKMVFSISLVTESQQGREGKSLRRLQHTQQCLLKCTWERAPFWGNESVSDLPGGITMLMQGSDGFKAG